MESQQKFCPNPKLKLMEQVTEVPQYHHYAYRSEQAYCQWIRRYIIKGLYTICWTKPRRTPRYGHCIQALLVNLIQPLPFVKEFFLNEPDFLTSITAFLPF